MIPESTKLQERVRQAAEAVLARSRSIGPLDLFLELRMLPQPHYEAWRRGDENYKILRRWIQVGPAKFQKIVECFQAWAQERGLQPMEAALVRQTPGGTEVLQVTEDGQPEGEQFYRTHYARADLTESKITTLKAKLNRPPELVVFQKVGDEAHCSECGAELGAGELLLMEKGQPLCLACADMDHLVFLPAGDMALTRRARKHSSLAAVVVRFNRRRKRYERQGLLVTEEALNRAEEECAADAPERAAARARAAGTRAEADRQFVRELAIAITDRYPGCPPEEARRIAEHTGRRHSGRVGRSAAGQALQPKAIDLAVIAHVRHVHTHYDQLLMSGTERHVARSLVRQKIDDLLMRWR